MGHVLGCIRPGTKTIGNDAPPQSQHQPSDSASTKTAASEASVRRLPIARVRFQSFDVHRVTPPLTQIEMQRRVAQTIRSATPANTNSKMAVVKTVDQMSDGKVRAEQTNKQLSSVDRHSVVDNTGGRSSESRSTASNPQAPVRIFQKYDVKETDLRQINNSEQIREGGTSISVAESGQGDVMGVGVNSPKKGEKYVVDAGPVDSTNLDSVSLLVQKIVKQISTDPVPYIPSPVSRCKAENDDDFITAVEAADAAVVGAENIHIFDNSKHRDIFDEVAQAPELTVDPPPSDKQAPGATFKHEADAHAHTVGPPASSGESQESTQVCELNDPALASSELVPRVREGNDLISSIDPLTCGQPDVQEVEEDACSERNASIVTSRPQHVEQSILLSVREGIQMFDS